MYVRQRASGRRRRRRVTRRIRGRGFFGDLWSGVKSAVRKPSTWLSAGGLIPSPLSLPLRLAGGVAKFAGHGRRRRVTRRRRVGGARRRTRRVVHRRRHRGGALLGMLSPGYLAKKALSRLHSHVRSSRYASRGLNYLGNALEGVSGSVLKRIGDFAHSRGYGRRRVVRRRVVRRRRPVGGRRRVVRRRRVGRGGMLNMMLSPQRLGY